MGGHQQRANKNELSNEIKDLLKKRRETKNADSNIRRIEYTELCKTIRKRIGEDIKKYNEGLVESTTENRNSLNKTKRTLTIGKKQVVAVTENNIRTTDGNNII